MAEWDVVSQTPIETALNAPQRGQWDVVSQEPATPRTLMDRGNDTLEVAADSLSFGLLPKAAAKLKELRGSGSYDENLAENRRKVEEAGQRIGPTGRILASLGGGLLSGSALARSGATVLGHVPQGASIFTKALAGGIEGGLYGAASGAGHSTADDWKGVAKDATQEAKMGFAVGAPLTAAAVALPRVITPNIADSPERTRMANVLRNQGVDVMASQATGAPTLATIEDAARRLPMGRHLSAITPESQMEQLTAAAAQRSGLQGPAATEHVLNQGLNDVGHTIGRIQRQYPIQQDPQYIQGLINVANDIPLLQNGGHVIQEFVSRLVPNGQTLNPEMMQAVRTQLRLARQKGPNADPLFNRALEGLRNTVDDALERTITATGNAADVATLQQARQHYANIHTLMDAMSRSGPAGQLGQLTPAALKNALSASVGKTDYMRGRGDLNELAKGAAGVLPVKPGSGTAEREAVYNPLKWALSIPLNAAINSRPAQAYLGNQALPMVTQPQAIAPAVAGLLAERNASRRRGLLGQ